MKGASALIGLIEEFYFYLEFLLFACLLHAYHFILDKDGNI